MENKEKSGIGIGYAGVSELLPDLNTGCFERLGNMRAESLQEFCNNVKNQMEVIKKRMTVIKYLGVFKTKSKLRKFYENGLNFLSNSKTIITESQQSLRGYEFNVIQEAQELKTQLDILHTDMSSSKRHLTGDIKKPGFIDSVVNTIKLRTFLKSLLRQK